MEPRQTSNSGPVVMVAWNEDEAAESALAWAARYARLAQGRLFLVHVAVPAIPISVELPPTPISADEIARTEARMRESAQRYDVPYDVTVAIATSIGAGLVAAVREHDASLLCTGHSRGPLAQLLLGSVANYLVRSSPVPVVTVRAGAT